MVDLMQLSEAEQEQLKALLHRKTGMKIERPGSLMTLNLATLLKRNKKK